MMASAASFHGRKTAVANGSLSLVAIQKAKEGEDPLKTGMNKGESEKLGSRPILVTFVGSKVTRRRNSGPR
jgi:sorbitol-specific phosphotransferase system component IIA